MLIKKKKKNIYYMQSLSDLDALSLNLNYMHTIKRYCLFKMFIISTNLYQKTLENRPKNAKLA